MPQREPRLLTRTSQVAADLGFLLFLSTSDGAHAAPRGELGSLPELLIDLLLVVKPLVPLLAGAALFKLKRSHLIAAALPALGCGAWGAWTFYRLSADDPLSDALVGLGLYGISGGLLALAGSGYVRLIGVAAQRLATQRTAILHTLAIALLGTAFVLLLLTHSWNAIAVGLYLVLIAMTFGASAVTGSLGGGVVTMTFALIAMMFCILVAALLSSVRDLNEAGMLIFYVPRRWCRLLRPPSAVGGSAAACARAMNDQDCRAAQGVRASTRVRQAEPCARFR